MSRGQCCEKKEGVSSDSTSALFSKAADSQYVNVNVSVVFTVYAMQLMKKNSFICASHYD